MTKSKGTKSLAKSQRKQFAQMKKRLHPGLVKMVGVATLVDIWQHGFIQGATHLETFMKRSRSQKKAVKRKCHGR